jgi:hypothetical protein
MTKIGKCKRVLHGGGSVRGAGWGSSGLNDMHDADDFDPRIFNELEKKP